MKPPRKSTARNGKDNLRAAVFLDRDGTIIEDHGDLFEPLQVVFFRDTITALRLLCKHFDLFIVTNQSGVAKGSISLQDVERVNSHVASYLTRYGVPIVETYVCPHERAARCHCIKPNPYFLKRAEADFGIDLKRSFVIGDHPHDVELAASVGAIGIYVLSGHGMEHRSEISVDTVVTQGIREAAEYILKRAVHAED